MVYKTSIPVTLSRRAEINFRDIPCFHSGEFISELLQHKGIVRRLDWEPPRNPAACALVTVAVPNPAILLSCPYEKAGFATRLHAVKKAKKTGHKREPNVFIERRSYSIQLVPITTLTVIRRQYLAG
jgi:hypothetical protein